MHMLAVPAENRQQLVHGAAVAADCRDEIRQKPARIGVRVHPRRALRPDGEAEPLALSADLDLAQLTFDLLGERRQRARHLRRVHGLMHQRTQGRQRIIQPDRLLAIAQLELAFLNRIHDAFSQCIRHVVFSPFFIKRSKPISVAAETASATRQIALPT